MKLHITSKHIYLLLLFSFMAGCNALPVTKKAPRKNNIVGATVDDQNASVEIREETDEEGNVIKKDFNHPYYFTGAGLANILSSVYYKQRGLIKGSSKNKLFRQEELQDIVPPIISAFSMANESQDILVFSTSDKILLSDRQSYFSLFISGNELNIVFSAIQSKKSYNDGRAFRKSNKHKFKDPMEVKKSSYWSLIPMGGQRLSPGRQNWIIIDLGNNLYGVPHNETNNEGGNVKNNAVKSDNSKKEIERRVRTDKTFIKEKRKYQDVREKLRELKELKDEGLISEKDYEIKKKELLKQF